MRELASEELHIGGFTDVQLEHPVVDVAPLAEAPERSQAAVVFFLCACMLRGATIARVHVASSAQGRALIDTMRRAGRGAIARIDGENVALMRYFDLYLKPLDELSQRSAATLARTLERALSADAG